MKKEQDLRYIKTENLIRETFRTLILAEDYSKITIKKLTEQAQINRKTFYMHYETLDDLLTKMQCEIYEDFFKNLTDIKKESLTSDLVRAMFLFFSNANKSTERILCIRGNFAVGTSPADCMQKHIMDLFVHGIDFEKYSELEINIISRHFMSSFLSAYWQWVDDGQKIPIERIILLTTQLIKQGTDGICI